LVEAISMQDSPKRLRRLIREWAAVAYDRDLRHAFGELRSQFDRLERGEISPFELNELVHRFHDGISREIWKRYSKSSHLGPAVAAAVADGVISKEELPPELVEHLARTIAFYEADQAGW
jgi:hypothetical protein